MSIDQERISNVLTNNRCLIYIYIINVVHKIDSSSLASIGWLHNPDILLAFMLLQFLVVIVEVTKLIWQNVGIRAEIKGRLSKSFLHTHNIEAKSIFTSDLITLWKMVDFLILIKTFILV